MAANEISTEKFLHAYGNLLVATWGDPELKQRFKDSTVEVLKEYGLDPGDAKVNIKAPGEVSNPEATIESQVKLWNEGLKSGSIDFYYPEEPPEGAENMELTEEQLEAVAGGWSISCCSCTPCCCC